MKIRQAHSDFSVEVYGIYWAEYQGKLQRFHLVIPEKGYPGFITVPESECELVDPKVIEFIIIKNERGQDALIHPLLHQEGLLDRIIDHDPDAIRDFLLMITCDGNDIKR